MLSEKRCAALSTCEGLKHWESHMIWDKQAIFQALSYLLSGGVVWVTPQLMCRSWANVGQWLGDCFNGRGVGQNRRPIMVGIEQLQVNEDICDYRDCLPGTFTSPVCRLVHGHSQPTLPELPAPTTMTLTALTTVPNTFMNATLWYRGEMLIQLILSQHVHQFYSFHINLLQTFSYFCNRSVSGPGNGFISKKITSDCIHFIYCAAIKFPLTWSFW